MHNPNYDWIGCLCFLCLLIVVLVNDPFVSLSFLLVHLSHVGALPIFVIRHLHGPCFYHEWFQQVLPLYWFRQYPEQRSTCGILYISMIKRKLALNDLDQ